MSIRARIMRQAAIVAALTIGTAVVTAVAVCGSGGSILLAVAVSAALAAVVAWFTMQRLIGGALEGIEAIERSAAAALAGDFAVTAGQLDADRPFALIGCAVNCLLDERVRVMAEARAESERINESVIALLEAVEQLSRRDLTAVAPVTEDIVGAISDSINKLAQETATVLGDVNDVALQVERASRDVKSQADQVSANAVSERQGLKGMVDVLSRASESMQRVALLAYNCNRVAGQASKATERAMDSVASTVTGMSSIRATITDVERRIKRLGERSHEIGQIVNLINTLSERTHVLALNASMQAAMAGEAGRGFAVVAEEVQRLAESSREATDRIGKLIYNIQVETTDAIGAMAKTIDRIVHEASVAEASGTQMGETRDTTAKLVEMVGRISLSAEEQMTIATQLRARIDEIGAGNASNSEQLAAQHAATESLLGLAARLVAAVHVFKLPATASR